MAAGGGVRYTSGAGRASDLARGASAGRRASESANGSEGSPRPSDLASRPAGSAAPTRSRASDLVGDRGDPLAERAALSGEAQAGAAACADGGPCGDPLFEDAPAGGPRAAGQPAQGATEGAPVPGGDRQAEDRRRRPLPPVGEGPARGPSTPGSATVPAGARRAPSAPGAPGVWTRAGRAARTGAAAAGKVAAASAVPADGAENGRTDRLEGAFRLAATRALKGGGEAGRKGLRAPSAPAGRPEGRAARVWRRAKTAAAAPVRAIAVAAGVAAPMAASAEDGRGSPLRGVAPELASRAISRALEPSGPRRGAGRKAGPDGGGARSRTAPRGPSASPKGTGPDLTARMQDRVFQNRSRAVRAARGARAAPSGARAAAQASARGAARAAGRSAAGVLRALFAGAGASLAPFALVALAAAAVLLSVVGLVGAVLSAGFFGMQQGTYSSMARVALTEYESGVADGSYHHDDPKYWTYATGSTYSDGASTPWCAAFVSWCANECGYVDSGLFPRTAGVGSILAHFEADPNLGSVVDFADYDHPRPGDIICYGSASGSGPACSDHVGIVVSVEGSSSDGYSYFYTVEGNTSSDGMGGDSARVGRHVFWNNNAGIADAPQWQLTYWDYAKVIQLTYPEAAYGDIEIPETYTADDGVTYRVGTFATREWDPGVYSFDEGTDAWRVEQAWKARGAAYDPRGFSTIDGKYMIACTSTFGTVGDEIVFYFDDGTELECVMTDTKDQSTAHGTPATMWGHRDFASRQIGVLEFLGTPAIGDNPYVALGRQGARVVGATNLGRYV